MDQNTPAVEQASAATPTSRLIDWFAVGQGCEIEVEGVRFQLRVVGQKGRRTRIAIIAPEGAAYDLR